MYTLTLTRGTMSLSLSFLPEIGQIISFFLISFSTHSMVTTSPLQTTAHIQRHCYTVRTATCAHTHVVLSAAQGIELPRESYVTGHMYRACTKQLYLHKYKYTLPTYKSPPTHTRSKVTFLAMMDVLVSLSAMGVNVMAMRSFTLNCSPLIGQ